MINTDFAIAMRMRIVTSVMTCCRRPKFNVYIPVSAVVLAAGLPLTLLLSDPVAAAPVPGKPADVSKCVSITSKGAVSNGPDATSAIQVAITAASDERQVCLCAGRHL
ncbi:MAG: hypothetical protein IPK78_09655 [Rhodospirillales bacterium]|nr:hypothetical protein [Rhodospirillales bacterium]